MGGGAGWAPPSQHTQIIQIAPRHIQEGLDSQDNYLPPLFICWGETGPFYRGWGSIACKWQVLDTSSIPSGNFISVCRAIQMQARRAADTRSNPPPLPRHFSRRAIAFRHTSALENSIMHAGERCLSRDVMRTEFDLHVLLQTIYFQCNRVSSMLWSPHWIVWLLYLATEQNLNSALEMN